MDYQVIASILLIGFVTIACLIYHVRSFQIADQRYEECEQKCDDGKERQCRESVMDTIIDCDPYYKCVDECKK